MVFPPGKYMFLKLINSYNLKNTQKRCWCMAETSYGRFDMICRPEAKRFASLRGCSTAFFSEPQKVHHMHLLGLVLWNNPIWNSLCPVVVVFFLLLCFKEYLGFVVWFVLVRWCRICVIEICGGSHIRKRERVEGWLGQAFRRADWVFTKTPHDCLS